jgi:hypothetical protein
MRLLYDSLPPLEDPYRAPLTGWFNQQLTKRLQAHNYRYSILWTNFERNDPQFILRAHFIDPQQTSKRHRHGTAYYDV